MSGLPLSLRLGAFRMGEWLLALRQRATSAGRHVAVEPQTTPPSVWIFVSTIGELNAIQPFVNRLLDETGQPPVTLISDRTTYEEAYRSKFPTARLEVTDGTWASVRRMLNRRPPCMLLVAEIPAVLHDAPCRFSYAAVHAARSCGAPVVLVNGWLYGYTPPSRMDAVEHAWFGRDYVRAYDLMLVQTEAVRQRLVEHGAAPDRVVVTGNIKFDAMLPAASAAPLSPLQQALRRRAAGPLLVAGSVTETADQRGVLQAFCAIRALMPQALLVLAPRHPENLPRMTALLALLDEFGLGWRRRSEHAPEAAAAGPVLILDTMGELRGCYAEATLAYVGTDHNVLEPLAFGKPVFVSGEWEPTYPSYPVYRQLLEAGALNAVADIRQLGNEMTAYLASAAHASVADHERVEAVLQRARGAVQRNMEEMGRRGLLRAARDG